MFEITTEEEGRRVFQPAGELKSLNRIETSAKPVILLKSRKAKN